MFYPKYSNKTAVYSRLSLVISGSVFEFYEFAEPIMYGERAKGRARNKKGGNKDDEESLLSSARRAKRNISRLIRCNAFKWADNDNKPYMPIILTLTFADEIRDIEKANDLFSNFIQRLNYSVNLVERGYFKKEAKKNLLKYSAVIEFQDKNRGGVIHYHIIFYNLPKMAKIYDRLNKIWGKGYFWVGTKPKNKKQKSFAYVKDNDKINKVVKYFTKYITKSFDDARLKSKKKYFNSRELFKPQKIIIEKVVDMIKKQMPKGALIYEAKDFKYTYLRMEKSFDYFKFDLADYPDELAEAMELAKSA
ncbi:MAG: hypothetical protein V1770_04965 [bacterium]